MNLLQCSETGRKDRAAERRQRLLDTARKLFVEKGFHATGVAQLAAASGIKVGQIYRDFASKEDIVAAICQGDMADFLDDGKLCSAVESRDTGAIRDWIASFVDPDDSIDDRLLIPEIIAESARNPRAADVLAMLDNRVRESLIAALEALAPAPALEKRRRLLADLIMTLCMGILIRRISYPALDLIALSAEARRLVERELDALQR